MGFLSDEENIIGMDMTGYGDGHFTDHDLEMLHDAGIKTLWYMSVDWNKIEPAKGQYDWSSLDTYMERASKYGFKVLMNCYHDTIKWGSDHWYIWSARGVQKNWISPWSQDGVEYMFNFYRKMKERYTTSTSLVINSFNTEGEYILPDCQIYSGAAQNIVRPQEIHEMFTWMLVEQTRILEANPWNEVWTMLHPHLVPDDWIEEIVSKYTRLGFQVNHLYFTWRGWQPTWAWMSQLRQKYNENVFGGAEWASGILETTPHAISQGLRGLLVGPCHPYTHEDSVKPWMTETITKSIQMFKNR
jgi:hypothetical protein